MNEQDQPLIAYFSCSGETRNLAKTLTTATQGTLFEIVPQTRYTASDLDWNNKGSRSTLEMKDAVSRPAIAQQVENMDAYSTVFVGFPIWWYDAPRIIATFLESYDFSGKTVIPFATSGGSGMGDIDRHLQALCSKTTKWKPGKRLDSRATKNVVQKWLDTLN